MAAAANFRVLFSWGTERRVLYKIIYCIVIELKTGNEISASDIRLIDWRTEFSNLKIIYLDCMKKYLLTRSESLQKACYNPFQTHAKAFSSKQLLYTTFLQSNSKKYINKQPLRDVL